MFNRQLCFETEAVSNDDTNLIYVNYHSQSALMAHIRDCFSRGVGFNLATINLDHLVKIKRNDSFKAAYKDHDTVVADGFPIALLAKISGTNVELIRGSDLLIPLLLLAAEMRVDVAFVGSTKEALLLAKDRLLELIPELRVTTLFSPPFGYEPNGKEFEEVADVIGKSQAKLCILALGAPKQEITAIRLSERIPTLCTASLGASLDFIAGSQKRAPRIFQRMYLEWLWRMLANPKRMFRRYILCIGEFPLAVLAVLAAKIK